MRSTGSHSPTPPRGVPAVAATLCLAVALALSACGERSFTVDEFIDEANANGVTLTLGEPLSTEQGGAELYAVTISDQPAGAAGSDGIQIAESHGGGSLRVEDDTEAAEAEYARCEQAGLFCYRAANVVLVFEADAEPEALGELARALRAIQDE